MATTEIGINLVNNIGDEGLTNWNNIQGATVAEVKSSDLVEINQGSATGYTLTLNGAFSGSTASTAFATSSPDARFPLVFFEGAFFVSLTDDDAATFTIGNLPIGAGYKIEAAGANGRTDRPTTFSATGSTPAAAQYAGSTTVDPVPQPVILEGTVPAGGEIIVSNIGSSAFSYNNGFLLTITTESGPTITDINTTNEVTPGATATATCTNATNATGLNIGSVSQAGFTVVNDTTVTFTGTRGGNPYNQDLTATLLSPDGDATITVQQVPEAGTFAVTAASPNTTDDASLWSGLVDTATGNPVTVVDGDQAWVKDPNNLGTVEVPFSITPSGEISAGNEGSFVVQFRRASEGVWGSDQAVSFTLPVDPEVPNPPGIGRGLKKALKLTLKNSLRKEI